MVTFIYKKNEVKNNFLFQVNNKDNFDDDMNLEQVYKTPKVITYYGSKRIINNKFK